jgi:IS4 transposase
MSKMVLSEILQRFVDQRPVAVMVRAVLEKQFADSFFDTTFDEVAQQQYTRTLALSTCAKVVAQVTLGRAASVHAAFVKEREIIAVSISSLYEKLQHIEPVVCEELVRRSTEELTEVVTFLGRREEPIAGYRLRIVDGNVLAHSEHRLQELRGCAAAAMPGKSLVLYDYATDLISDLVTCEDGEANERRLLPQLLDKVQVGDLIMADRNFSTMLMLTELVQRKATFLIRHHAGLPLTFIGQAERCGRCKTGVVYEQQVQLNCGLECRAIIIHRDQPLQDGGVKVVLLTNVPAKKGAACPLANLYLQRWTIEEAFRQLTEYLSCEVQTLGYPKAALFAFTMAVLAFNTLTCVKAALRATHSEGQENWSTYYMAWEVKATFEGMQVAVPPAEWQPFAAMTNESLAEFLRQVAAKIDPARYAKHKRGPKKTVRRKKAKSRHVSTAKILQARKLKRTQTQTS